MSLFIFRRIFTIIIKKGKAIFFEDQREDILGRRTPSGANLRKRNFVGHMIFLLFFTDENGGLLVYCEVGAEDKTYAGHHPRAETSYVPREGHEKGFHFGAFE